MINPLIRRQLRSRLREVNLSDAQAAGYDAAYAERFKVTTTNPRILTAAVKHIYDCIGMNTPPVLAKELVELLPQADSSLQVALPSRISGPMALVDSCEYAETSFVDVAEQVNSMSPNALHNQVSVYHDDHGTPLFLRKQYIESTALSLVPMVSGDMPIPPGTIVALGKPKKKVITGKKNVTGPDSYSLSTLFSSIRFDTEKDQILPLRLSAYAFTEPMDRALFATSTPSYKKRLDIDGERLKLVKAYSVEDFQKTAANLLANCVSAD